MSDKEFPPSIKRLTKARKEGKIVKSRMVSLAASWWGLILVLFPAFAWVRNGTLVQWSDYKVWTPQVALAEASWLGLKVLVFLTGVVAVASCSVEVMQAKGLFAPSQLLKGAEAYQPGALIGKIKQALLDSAVGLVRCLLLGIVLYPILVSITKIEPSAFIGIESDAEIGFVRVVRQLLLRGGMFLLLIAAVGYFLARWRFLKGLRMNLQELKDEHKENEGDPHSKAARKHEHRMLLMSEVEKRVKRSKVVIVSPVANNSG
jgi:flagellar biosynthetic protein FlhB